MHQSPPGGDARARRVVLADVALAAKRFGVRRIKGRAAVL